MLLKKLCVYRFTIWRKWKSGHTWENLYGQKLLGVSVSGCNSLIKSARISGMYSVRPSIADSDIMAAIAISEELDTRQLFKKETLRICNKLAAKIYVSKHDFIPSVRQVSIFPPSWTEINIELSFFFNSLDSTGKNCCCLCPPPLEIDPIKRNS